MLGLNKYNAFNVEKIIQVIAYIQRELNCTDKRKLLKLLYFADRIHLHNHFSLISHDIYYALINGPVGLKSSFVINNYEYFLNNTPKMLEFMKKIITIDKDNITINETNTDLTSKNTRAILSDTCRTFGKFSLDALIEISKDYPEWKQYEEDFNYYYNGGEMILISDFFKNPNVSKSPAIIKYLNGIDPLYVAEDKLSGIKEMLSEDGLLRY
jgi:uncharacterized phage-associated protein